MMAFASVTARLDKKHKIQKTTNIYKYIYDTLWLVLACECVPARLDQKYKYDTLWLVLACECVPARLDQKYKYNKYNKNTQI